MAIINCPHCGYEPLYDQARECPACKRDPKTPRNIPNEGIKPPPIIVDAGYQQVGAYEAKATSATPALFVFLFDFSQSMQAPLKSGGRKIDVVPAAYKMVMERMLTLAMRGSRFSDKYAISAIAYGSSVRDLFEQNFQLVSVREAKDLSKTFARFATEPETNAALGFARVEELLKSTLPHLQDSPAPVVCHVTDGDYRHPSQDPRPVVERIRRMGTRDGNVLISNVYVGDDLTRTDPGPPELWEGARRDDLVDGYVQTLFDMSSKLPKSYAEEMEDNGYSMRAGVKMLFPCHDLAFVRMAIALSTNTP